MRVNDPRTRLVWLVWLWLLMVSPAWGQPVMRLASTGATDTLSSNGDSMTLAVGGMAALRLQTLDTYSGTWELQCSVDSGTTFDADDEINLVLEGSSGAFATAVTDTVGVWTANIAGCTHVKAIATAGFAATDTVVTMVAIATGGGTSAGGDATLLEQQTQTVSLLQIEAAVEGTIVVNSELPTAAALADDTANPTVPGVAAFNMCYDGSTWDRCPPDPAHDAVDSGNPLKIGGRALTGLTGAALPASADRVNATWATDGALLTRHALLEDIVTATPVGITDGSSTSVIAAAGASIKIYLTSCTIVNSSATNVTVDLRDGAAGAVKWTFQAPANFNGVTHAWPVPLPFSANTAVAADPSAAATTVIVSCLGFRSRL